MPVWLLVVIIVVAGLAAAGGIGWSHLSREHEEAMNLPLNTVDFSTLKDGVYQGAYEGGMYGWRANECRVTVENGKVTDIQLIGSQDPGGDNTDHHTLYEQVITSQTLRVDTISGATLTSKAYLKAVENALIPAQN